MKKYLALLLILLSVLAVLVACTFVSPGGDTTEAQTTAVVTDPDTETEPDSANPVDTTAAVEETTVIDPDEIITPETTAAPETETAEPDPTGVRLNHERVEKQFQSPVGVKVTREELEDEGYVVKITSTGVSSDPQVFFNYNNYRRVVGGEKLLAQDYQYVILRVKTEQCSSAKFELFYCAGSVSGATGDCVLQSSFNNASDDWQYIVFNMTNANAWSGQINGFRFDYQLSTAGAGETMYISAVWFAKDVADAL